jgi:hypothetical protein
VLTLVAVRFLLARYCSSHGDGGFGQGCQLDQQVRRAHWHSRDKRDAVLGHELGCCCGNACRYARCSVPGRSWAEGESHSKKLPEQQDLRRQVRSRSWINECLGYGVDHCGTIWKRWRSLASEAMLMYFVNEQILGVYTQEQPWILVLLGWLLSQHPE